MLSVAQFDELSTPITNLYAEFEQAILEDIARRIIKMGNPTATAAWQVQRLSESGSVYENVIKELSKLTGKSEQTLRQTFEQAGVKTLKYDDAIYKAAGLNPLPLNLSPQMLDVLRAGLNKTNSLISNLTSTTALASQQVFIDSANLVYQEVITGSIGYDQAIRNAILKVGDSALAVIYPTGHTDKLDVAIRRAILTGVGQTTGQLQLGRALEMGSDLVEVSAHIGARPTHQIWQGQVYSISGASEKYKPFIESTGYGTGPGLLGWNCRHSFAPFFEGLSKRSYTDAELAELERNVIYDGKKLSAYEASQVQRGIERKIREWKRKAGVLQAAGLDNTKEINKVKQWRAKARDFVNQTKLNRQYVRERI